MKPAELVVHWRELAESAARYGAGCAGLRQCAADLEAALNECDEETVSVPEASALSGFSEDHLRRLLTQGRLRNAGRKGKPRIRRADVPIKPGHSLRAEASRGHFSDRSAVVASVIPRRAS